MGMFKSIGHFARGTYGIYGVLRRLLRLLEWNLEQGIIVRSRGEEGGWEIYGSTPPSEKAIKEALKDKRESIPYEDEEALAMDRLVEILQKRAKGEEIPDDDPGKGYKPW